MKNPRAILTDQNLLIFLACLGALLHTLFNGQYGFHCDELDILMNARQLAWGYVACPPFTPFIARIGLELFGNSLQGLRLFSALAQGLVMFLAGQMARDMGGKRRAQVMAAIAAYGCRHPDSLQDNRTEHHLRKRRFGRNATAVGDFQTGLNVL